MRGGPRRRARMAAATLTLLFVIAGCYPVPTVVGRSAAVLPHGMVRESIGGGSLDYDVTGGGTMPEGMMLTEDLKAGCVHASRALGLGKGIDFESGWNNGQLYALLRWQPVGSPDTHASISTSPVDVSVEFGGSFMAAAFMVAGMTPAADAHVGVNVSFPGSTATPYVSCRRHAVKCTYWDDSLDVYDAIRFRQTMLFLGVEFGGGSPRRDTRMCIEAFYGRSDDMAPAPDGIAAEVWGVNVIVGRVKW